GGGASAGIITTAGRPLVTVVVAPLPATGVGVGGETYAHHQCEQRRQDAGSKHGYSAPSLRYAPGRPSSSVGLNFGVSHSHRMVLKRIVLRCVGRIPPASQRRCSASQRSEQ